jgi:predicted TIM-barrel fold metal-dependent hydrolase
VETTAERIMNQGLLDCDTHFTDHLPELWADEAIPVRPAVVADSGGHPRLSVGDLLFPRPDGSGCGNPRGLGHLIGEGGDDDREAFMAEQGIAAAVLQPGFAGLSVQMVADTEVRLALLTRYNDLAAAACAASRLDLRWAILLSAEDARWSAAEVARHADDPCAVGVVLRPTARTSAFRLSDPALTPVLEQASAGELTLFLHGGTGCHQWSPLADAYADYVMTHAFGHMGEHMVALADLLTRPGGLPDGLSVVMLESGVAWIPAVLARLDGHFRRLSDRQATPTDLFRRHFGVVPDPDEAHARWACEQLGAGSVLFGSDYPHWDTVRSRDWLAEFGELAPPATLAQTTRARVPRLARSPSIARRP